MLLEALENDSPRSESSMGFALRRLLVASVIPALLACATDESTRSVTTEYGVPEDRWERSL